MTCSPGFLEGQTLPPSLWVALGEREEEREPSGSPQKQQASRAGPQRARSRSPRWPCQPKAPAARARNHPQAVCAQERGVCAESWHFPFLRSRRFPTPLPVVSLHLEGLLPQTRDVTNPLPTSSPSAAQGGVTGPRSRSQPWAQPPTPAPPSAPLLLRFRWERRVGATCLLCPPGAASSPLLGPQPRGDQLTPHSAPLGSTPVSRWALPWPHTSSPS